MKERDGRRQAWGIEHAEVELQRGEAGNDRMMCKKLGVLSEQSHPAEGKHSALARTQGSSSPGVETVRFACMDQPPLLASIL